MGLDLVEMVMRIEEEFEIMIPDEVAETLVTPRAVIDYLMTLPEINKNRSREQVRQMVLIMVEDESGVSRDHFDENSRFIEDLGMD